MQRLHKDGELPKRFLDAWTTIHRGIEENDKELIWEGNKMLLKYEQEITLQSAIYDKYPKIADWFSDKVRSPIPGDHDEGRLAAFDPGSDLGDFDDRWTWISKSMLRAYRKLLEASPEIVMSHMEHLFLQPFFKNPK